MCRNNFHLSSSLSKLQIEGTMVTYKGILVILEHFHNLVELESSQVEEYLYKMQQFFARSTLFDAALAKDSSSSYQLQHLSICMKRSIGVEPSVTELLTLLFPKLKSLQIHQVHTKELQSLRFLAKLKRLSSLTIGSVSLDHLTSSLQTIGANLHTFKYLCYADSGGKINFSIISNNCPNLQKLAISGASLTYSDRTSHSRTKMFPHLV